MRTTRKRWRPAPASRAHRPTTRTASASTTRRIIGGHRWTFSQSIADVDPAEWGGVLVTEAR